MKLIDLLVQELPKRGGWPNGIISVAQSSIDGELYFYSKAYDGTGAHSKSIYCLELCDEHFNSSSLLPSVTREQYESALAASQKPAWNGEGLPPVGCECECQFLDAWHVCKVLFIGAEVIVGVIDGSERAFSVSHTKFRPIKSEAERKRDAAIEEMIKIATIHTTKSLSLDLALNSVYNAIAAGKIPGVKLDD